MSDEHRSRPEEDALPSALVHPLRGRVLRSLRRGHLSSKEIAASLSAPRSSVSEQLRRLREEGLIFISEMRGRRGALERLYHVCEAADNISGPAVLRLDPGMKKRIAAGLVRVFMESAARAMKTEDPVSAESTWSSIEAPVDTEGWNELVTIHREAALRANRVIKEAEVRLEYRKAAPDRVISSSVFLFEQRLDRPVDPPSHS